MMCSLEAEFAQEMVRRDTLESIQIIRSLSYSQFQSLLRFFLPLTHQDPFEREEWLENLQSIKQLSQQDYEALMLQIQYENQRFDTL